jgi:hypothetical protein
VNAEHRATRAHSAGGPASKWPVDAAAADAGMDGPSKTLRGTAVHTRLDAGKRTPAPTSRLENRPNGRPVFHSAHRPRLRLSLSRCN